MTGESSRLASVPAGGRLREDVRALGYGMAKDDKPRDLMHYEAMAQEARRGIVRAALKRAASPQGLPGEHHFYISFRTDAPGVSAPKDLLDKYPEEMTIVLQHRFRDLAPGETYFSVTLEFGGQPKTLSVPYAAITRFFDPSVQFLLQFEPLEAPPEPAPLPTAPPVAARTKAQPADAKADADADEPKVISLDQFRKK
jgi:hypothetical protein